MQLHAAVSTCQYAHRLRCAGLRRVHNLRHSCALTTHAVANQGRKTAGPSSQPTASQVPKPPGVEQSSGPVIPLTALDDSSATSATSKQPAAKQQQRKNTKHDSRRGALVNIRVAPRRYRLRQSFDQPRNVRVSPSDPTFEGRLTSEINSCYGPRQLSKIIKDFGPNLTADHCAAAIALLAGLVTSKQPTIEDIEAVYQPPAARVADIFTAKISQASMMDCARVVYGLARLRLHVPRLLAAVEQHTAGQLSNATPQALAGIAVGLSHWGYKPRDGWIQELMTQSFASMSAFGAQDLANLLFALACWEVSTSQPFLQRCLTAFRGHWDSAGCHAPTLVRFIFAVTQLPACQPLPEGSTTSGQQQGEDSYSNKQTGGPADRAVATYRLPSFNWLVAFLSECRRQIDRMKPAELSTLLWSMACLNHTPDLVFMECWYRACAVHMHAFTAQSLSTALQAIGMLQPGKDVPGAISGRWLQLVLQKSKTFMVSGSCSELVKMLWGFAEIRVWPGQPWMDDWLEATQQQLHDMTPQDLSDAIWALARLRYTPPEPWTQVLTSAVNENLSGFEAQGLAIVIWSFSSLGLKPDRRWLITFKGLSGSQFDDDSAQQLAKLVAGALAQQNRRQFSKPAVAEAAAAGPHAPADVAVRPLGRTAKSQASRATVRR
eukprot:GHUV01019013.1.p1 GENE.GHUV01019013.1~~GHUV01019013.1.p1  ORF type:complete len:662 (+),score=160.67 GHUV01019013.1:433-2418(+)